MITQYRFYYSHDYQLLLQLLQRLSYFHLVEINKWISMYFSKFSRKHKLYKFEDWKNNDWLPFVTILPLWRAFVYVHCHKNVGFFIFVNVTVQLLYILSLFFHILSVSHCIRIFWFQTFGFEGKKTSTPLLWSVIKIQALQRWWASHIESRRGQRKIHTSSRNGKGQEWPAEIDQPTDEKKSESVWCSWKNLPNELMQYA